MWVAVQSDNLLFPKQPEIPRRDRRWRQQVVHTGTPSGETFALALLEVGAEGQRLIEDWLGRGKDTKRFPGLEELPGRKLDVVSDVVAR